MASLALLPESESNGADFISYSKRCDEITKGLNDDGQLAVRVTVKAGAFKTWCEANGEPINKTSITKYIAWKHASDAAGLEFNHSVWFLEGNHITKVV